MGGIADEAVQHVSERLRVVPAAHGRGQLVAHTNINQMPESDGQTDVPTTVYTCDTAPEVNELNTDLMKTIVDVMCTVPGLRILDYSFLIGLCIHRYI